MDMSGVFAFLQSTETLLEVAQFYRELSDRIPGEVSAHDDARQLARLLGIKVPAVLDGAAIHPLSDKEHETLRGTRITIEFPEEELDTHGAVARGKGGGGKHCWQQCWGALIGKVCLNVCANCGIKGTSVSCTVTITISASL
jgi:hypothetical protein